MAERDAAIHAARALCADFVVGTFLIDLKPVVHPLGERTPCRSFACVFEKAGCFTHGQPRAAGVGAGDWRLGRTQPPASSPALVCTRAGKPSQISAAFVASVPESTCRVGCLSPPRVARSNHGLSVGR